MKNISVFVYEIANLLKLSHYLKCLFIEKKIAKLAV